MCDLLNHSTRREFIKHAGVGSLSASLYAGLGLRAGSLGAQQKVTDDEVVRIGYLPITDAASLLIAHELGFFKSEGLTSQRPTLIRGWSPLVESFIAKKFNLVHLLKPIPIWMRFNHKIPVKIVAWAHTNGSALLVGRHVKANSIKHLGGKNFAVPYWYSIHNIILQKLLRENRLIPVIKSAGAIVKRNEVNLQILPPPDMPVALLAKKIDGYIVAEPFNALGEVKAGAKILRFTGDIWKNHPCCVITMHEEHLQNRTWSQKVINAIVKAEIYASQNKKEVAKVLSKERSGLLPFPRSIIERAMLHYDDKAYEEVGANRHKAEWKNGRIDFQPYPYPSATEYLIDAMKDTLVEGEQKFLQLKTTKTMAKDLVDDSFVTTSLKSNPSWVDDNSVEDKQNPFQRQEKVVTS